MFPMSLNAAVINVYLSVLSEQFANWLYKSDLYITIP